MLIAGIPEGAYPASSTFTTSQSQLSSYDDNSTRAARAFAPRPWARAARTVEPHNQPARAGRAGRVATGVSLTGLSDAKGRPTNLVAPKSVSDACGEHGEPQAEGPARKKRAVRAILSP